MPTSVIVLSCKAGYESTSVIIFLAKKWLPAPINTIFAIIILLMLFLTLIIR